MTKKELVKKNILEEQRELRKKKELLILWEDLIANINDTLEKCTEEELETANSIEFHYELLNDGRWERIPWTKLYNAENTTIRLTKRGEICEVDNIDILWIFLNQVTQNTQFGVSWKKACDKNNESYCISYLL